MSGPRIALGGEASMSASLAAPASPARPSLRDPRWPAPRLRDRIRALFRDADQLTLATLPDRLAALYGERPAFFLETPIDVPGCAGTCVTHADLARVVGRAARGFAALGVGAGERVGLVARNRIEAAFAEFAAARLGAVVVPVSALSRREELRALAADAQLGTMVVDRAVLDETLRGDLGGFPGVARWVVVGEGPLPSRAHAFAELCARDGAPVAPAPIRDADLAMLFYTAGTTGAPKGALLTHGALVFALRRQVRLAAWHPLAPRDLALLVMPLAHTSGHQAMLLQLALGTPVLLHGRFDPARVLAAIERHRVTQISGVPAMYRMLLDAGAERADLSSLGLVAWGGDAMPPELQRAFDAAVRRTRGRGPRWVSGYGLAESAGQQTRWIGRRAAPGAVGRPLRGVEVRITDERGTPLARGAIGELWLRSPGVMQGYWNAPELTREALADGWLRTGDLARRDRLGRLHLASRKKEVIKTGGYSVFPAEVEHALLAHPDVLAVAVAGVPHPVKGEVPAAMVVPRPGSGLDEAGLLAFARERITPYKAPRHAVMVESIPMSSAWKAKRGEVAALLRSRLGLG